MDALKEVPRVRQIEGEPRRRWFSSLDLDLIVWIDARAQPIGFQLCYDKTRRERALTWLPQRGFTHDLVDGGDHGSNHHKGTPILRPDGHFDRDRIRSTLRTAGDELPRQIHAFVDALLGRWPDAGRPVELCAPARPPGRQPPWWRFWG